MNDPVVVLTAPNSNYFALIPMLRVFFLPKSTALDFPSQRPQSGRRTFPRGAWEREE